MSEIADALQRVRERMERACVHAGRQPASVRLVAVSKRHPADAIAAAYAAGQRDFGENYVQELVGKMESLTHLSELRMRLIGHLQRNKAKEITRWSCAVDTVDSTRLADALHERAARDGRVIEVLLQVNVAREAQKSGALPEQLPELVAHVRALSSLSLRGLMTIPPDVDNPDDNRAWFASLRRLAEEHQLPELSMGMSGDLEAAIAEGSTMVRVGTAIFGARS